MEEIKVHKNIVVTGRVQGVFYRASAYDKALELGIKGFVKNQTDGSVYIEAEGRSENVMALVNWCREGPTYAHVESLKTNDSEWKGFDKFEIRRG